MAAPRLAAGGRLEQHIAFIRDRRGIRATCEPWRGEPQRVFPPSSVETTPFRGGRRGGILPVRTRMENGHRRRQPILSPQSDPALASRPSHWRNHDTEVQRWLAGLHATPEAANRSLPILSVVLRQAEVYGYRRENSKQPVHDMHDLDFLTVPEVER